MGFFFKVCTKWLRAFFCTSIPKWASTGFNRTTIRITAVRVPELSAVVPFYGGQAPVEEVPNINAPLLLQFADTDENVNKGWPAYEDALKANEKEYIAHFYPNTHHGFHNDTTPRYDKEAADLAWKRTVDFFNQTLK